MVLQMVKWYVRSGLTKMFSDNHWGLSEEISSGHLYKVDYCFCHSLQPRRPEAVFLPKRRL